MYEIDDFAVIDKGKDACFHCGMLQGFTTLTACEFFCPHYSDCCTVAENNDLLALYYHSEVKEKR